MKKLLAFFLLIALFAVPAWAWTETDADLETTHTVPIDIRNTPEADEWSAANASGLYLSAGGFAAGPDVPVPETRDNNGNVAFRLVSASCGSPVSEAMDDFFLGDWCTQLPYYPERGESIDWTATEAFLTNSAAYRTEGRLLYDPFATNDLERVMFTRGGKVRIEWTVATASGSNEVRPRTYMVAWTTSGRPYRLFWTKNATDDNIGFNGPPVSLSDQASVNRTKPVRLYGDPAILTPRDADGNVYTNETDRTGIAWGVDVSQHMIYAHAIPAATPTDKNRGPEGQFVLAYYDTDAKKLLCTIVVEVCEPKRQDLAAEVGDHLQPRGQGYSTDYIAANIVAGNVKDSGDVNSPYLYKHTGQTDFSPKSGWVYALAPNDAAHQDSETDSPQKAAIYWESTDPMGTVWPFEYDWYLIKWGTNLPKVVTGGTDAPGCGILLPSKFEGTAEVEHYSTPPQIAAASSNAVAITDAGKFLLKLIADDNVWFLPFESVLDTDAGCFDQTPGEWHVGMELEPRADAAAGTGAVQADAVDPDLPGYIHEAGSKARNWNPHLYRQPRLPTAAEEATGGTNSDNPWDTLESAIYAVRAATDPIEVWWFAERREDDMPAALRYPTSAQFYRAIWPLPEETHTIVLASQLGSAGESLAATDQALYLADNTSSASVPGIVPGNAGTGATIGFWLNTSPRAGGFEPVNAGSLFGFSNGEEGVMMLADEGGTNLVVGFIAPGSITDCTVPIPTNDWTHIAFVFGTNGTAQVFRDGKVAGTASAFPTAFLTNKATIFIGRDGIVPSATGTAIDHLAVWPFALTAKQLALVAAGGTNEKIERLRHSWTFDHSGDIVHVPGLDTRSALDDASGRTLVARNCLALGPGGPGRSSGAFATLDNVEPRVYVQNNPNAVGWNPNEEHAFMFGGVAYALRCDLNTTNSSEPFVLVEYNAGGKGAMKAFDVVATNSLYPSFESDVTAGNLLSGPHPLDFFEDYYNQKNYCEETATGDDRWVVYRDRHNRMWARRDGTTRQYNYYPVQEGFAFPSLDAQPARGTLVPWLSCLGKDPKNALSEDPAPWTWHAHWPADDKVPRMRVGQTLTTADSGLPEVWNALSMAVVYPVPRNDADGGDRSGTVATLIDPTVAQTAPLAIGSDFPSEYGFTIGPAGTCRLKSGKYRFSGLPPNISDRFYVEPSAAESNRMVLIGRRVEKKAGTSYLQINTLSAAERQALKDICKTTGKAKTRWDAGVDALAPREIQPSKRSTATDRVEVAYSPVDHYALVANGCGADYVTLIENDSPDEAVVPVGSTISMHVLRVETNLYAGPLVVLEDPENKLSEQLNILYAAPLGDSSDNYTFQWRKRTPPADGSVPAAGETGWDLGREGTGMTSVLVGGHGANLPELVNTYWEMRYQAREGTPARSTVGDAWSAWCGPTLAEGWVQRVLNNITPFAQRIDDFYDNACEISYTMPEQIGGPFRGDVALNNDNLESVGLVELYQTVLNKAESLSLSLGINNRDANKQLMEAASRLADLYSLLGDDAYSDAVNPTIETSSTDGYISDYKTFPASTYCFANQVPSLLDEELALMRGRSAAVAPNMTTYPYYNRLMWNFTKGITQGEMAYVQNYGIAGSDGAITAEQAAARYPMGHGDAWGHYLSALWGYYRLLRNPWFDWGDPSMMEMLVADSVVNMDYEDEQKFAMAAAKMAQVGADVMDLTARKTWRDQNGETCNGYFDADAEQAFGYGQWAVRSGLAALWNWATANSLLPTNATASAFDDQGISDITRSTVPALGLLAENFAAVDAKVNRLDAGLNPLGLSDNAIPFDIDPALLADGSASHFEQILDRAERALDNAQTVLDYADRFGTRLRQIAAAEADDADNAEEMEFACNKDLIAIFGTPYPDDIGPSGTYVQGYDGPDLFHYNYVDIKPYGLDSVSSSHNVSYTLWGQSNVNTWADTLTYISKQTNNWLNSISSNKTEGTVTVTYNVASGGLLAKPANWNSVRLTEGTIQAAYRDFLAAYVQSRHAIDLYKEEEEHLAYLVETIAQRYKNAGKLLDMQRTLYSLEVINAAQKAVTDLVIGVAETAESTTEIVTRTASNVPWVVGGFAVGTDAGHAIAGIAAGTTQLGIHTATAVASRAAKIVQAAADGVLSVIEESLKAKMADFEYYDTKAGLYESLLASIAAVQERALDIQTAYGALAAAEAAYRAEVEKGNQLLAEREMLRRHQSNTATARRYQDMFHRVQKNTALSKFNTAFDVAQRYVWQLAKVYDYETGLLSSDKQAGDAFLREVVATRALGEKGVSIVADGTDGGLWDVVTRMKGNWDVLKGRLGVNNPDTSTKWFSLRYSLFRIRPDAAGDAAWRRELDKYAVDDIFADPEVARYCQPPQGADGTLAAAEPGFVIPFSTTVNLAENFFGKPLLGGETTFSSSDYAVKIHAVGVAFDGYAPLAVPSADGLAVEPNIYLVPVGRDCMRTPAGTGRKTLAFQVVDQVLPLPYPVGSAELDDPDWLATFSGLDGTVDSAATIRRHSTMRMGGETTSTRLVGRSVWNDRWLLVIPASSLSSDRSTAMRTFVHGIDSDRDGAIDIPGVSDIRIGIKSYARSGN